ncbi:hypothetical protein R3P38DRAFT_3346094 [Favolaschia claudopus]|uniref:Transmembrane protein n=1 Tax=Favolaschia claudopus TaxID=2862362 RepID=A0AAW0D1I2_9AGAR
MVDTISESQATEDQIVALRKQLHAIETSLDGHHQRLYAELEECRKLIQSHADERRQREVELLEAKYKAEIEHIKFVHGRDKESSKEAEEMYKKTKSSGSWGMAEMYMGMFLPVLFALGLKVLNLLQKKLEKSME